MISVQSFRCFVWKSVTISSGSSSACFGIPENTRLSLMLHAWTSKTVSFNIPIDFGDLSFTDSRKFFIYCGYVDNLLMSEFMHCLEFLVEYFGEVKSCINAGVSLLN